MIIASLSHRVAMGLFFLSVVPPLLLPTPAVDGGPGSLEEEEVAGGADGFFISRRVIWKAREGGEQQQTIRQ